MSSQTNCVMMMRVHIISIILGRKHESIDMYKFQVRFQIIQVTGFDKLSCAYTIHKSSSTFSKPDVLDWLVNCLEKQLHLILEYADYSVYSTIIPLCNTNAKKNIARLQAMEGHCKWHLLIKLYNLSFLKWSVQNQSPMFQKCLRWKYRR